MAERFDVEDGSFLLWLKSMQGMGFWGVQKQQTPDKVIIRGLYESHIKACYGVPWHSLVASSA